MNETYHKDMIMFGKVTKMCEKNDFIMGTKHLKNSHFRQSKQSLFETIGYSK